MQIRYAPAIVLGVMLALPPALPGQVGLAARASTLGIGAELSFRATRMLGIRVGGNYLQFSRDATIDGISYHVTPHLESGTAILDFHPMGNTFHLSGGLLLNNNDGVLVATLAEDLQIGGQTYTPQEVGSLTGTVTFNGAAPYLGIGFSGRGRIGVLFDIGVGVTGKPKVVLVGETNLTGPEKAEFDANVEAERQKVQQTLDEKKYLRFHPVLSFGLRIGF